MSDSPSGPPLFRLSRALEQHDVRAVEGELMGLSGDSGLKYAVMFEHSSPGGWNLPVLAALYDADRGTWDLLLEHAMGLGATHRDRGAGSVWSPARLRHEFLNLRAVRSTRWQPLPIHMAAYHGNAGALDALLDLGADPLTLNGAGETALDKAVQQSSCSGAMLAKLKKRMRAQRAMQEIERAMQECSSTASVRRDSADEGSEFTSSSAAAAHIRNYLQALDDPSAVRELLFEETNFRGWPLILLAALYGVGKPVLEAFLEFCDTPEARRSFVNLRGINVKWAPLPLHMAAFHGHLRTVKALLELKADAHALNQNGAPGETALQKAEQEGKTDCTQLLRQWMAEA